MPYHGFQPITEIQVQIFGSDQEASLSGSTSWGGT